MSTPLFELMFTVAACMSLGMLFVAAAAVLPWREDELEEVVASCSLLIGRVATRPAEALRRAA